MGTSDEKVIMIMAVRGTRTTIVVETGTGGEQVGIVVVTVIETASRDASSGSSDSEATNIQKAEKYLYKHSDDYKKYVPSREQEIKDQEYKRQGELLAMAVGAKLDEALRSHAIIPGPVGQASQSPQPAPSPPPPPAPAVQTPSEQQQVLPAPSQSPEAVVPHDVLTVAQKIIVKTIWPSITFQDANYSEVSKYILKSWTTNPAARKKMDTFMAEHFLGTIPRAKEERIKAFFQTVRSLD